MARKGETTAVQPDARELREQTAAEDAERGAILAEAEELITTEIHLPMGCGRENLEALAEMYRELAPRLEKLPKMARDKVTAGLNNSLVARLRANGLLPEEPVAE